jgi:hypothetical protein
MCPTQNHEKVLLLTRANVQTRQELDERHYEVGKNNNADVVACSLIFDPKYPSSPRAHHPIICDSSLIWEFTGLVLVQVGNQSFQDSGMQVCKSRLLAELLCFTELFFC